MGEHRRHRHAGICQPLAASGQKEHLGEVRDLGPKQRVTWL